MTTRMLFLQELDELNAELTQMSEMVQEAIEKSWRRRSSRATA